MDRVRCNKGKDEMKAILVIEMPNNIDISKLKIGGDGNIYFLRDGEKASIVGNIRNIKPMPQKKEAYAESYTDRADEFSCKKHPLYAQGWNACIKEIEK